MVSKLRRLIADHAALHEDLPPNYLFPSEDGSDDMTQLTMLLAGPQGTPYSQGLWRLHLKMPEDYPKSPPKATFRTRIWHPNVEESTGAVCVDTLKRDWKSSLTLRDVLVTISCLLIYPNPDSALNSASGALLQEDYDAFARQAKLMTSIHAPVSDDMREAVTEAKMRGEDADTAAPERQQEEPYRNLRSRQGAGTRIQSLTMKKRQPRRSEHPTTPEPQQQSDDENENENPACSFKENDPSLSPVKLAAVPSSRALSLSPRKNAHGKRPLADLTTAMDVDPFISDSEDLLVPDMVDGMTASERNIAANTNTNTASIPFMTPTRETRSRSRDPSPQRKSPKLSLLNCGPNNTTRLRGENTDMDMQIYEDSPEHGKENHSSSSLKNPAAAGVMRSANPLAILTSSTTTSGASSASGSKPGLLKPGSGLGIRKVSGSGGLKKAKPRIGIRRL
ncbi:ubiquitin-conjugating enzyme/RWD-like protein [Aspergillus pseudodeflectus]|uniref:Ubiquitin-conjugating enzyme/RWD-like protein n=1 Tax=Aspergillus pseudodeflectus TaxID=176178 RepID=A0ABR4L165_9EURO